MTTKALVSGRSRARLAITLAAAIACLAVGVLAIPAQVSARLAATGRLDPECRPEETSRRCLLWRGEAARKQADFDQAAVLARKAIALEPLNVQALELLARSEDPRQAATLRRLISLTAKLTLHSSFSHLRLMEADLDAHRWDEAMFHADVLLRREVVVADSFYPGLMSLLNNQAGRAAIVKRLTMEPHWRVAFMQAMASTAKPAETMAFYSAMARQGLTPTPAEVEFLVGRLLNDNQYEPLRQLRQGLLPKGQSRSLVYDGEFDGLPGPASFIWRTLQLSGGEAILGSAETDHPSTLLLRHDLFSSSDWMTQQLLLLPPGRYQLTLSAQGLDDQGYRRFAVSVNCRAGSNLFVLPLKTDHDAWVLSKAEFTVPAEGCQAQWIAFSPLTGDRVEMAQILVDHVAIAPSTTPPPPPLQPPQAADAP